MAMLGFLGRRVAVSSSTFAKRVDAAVLVGAIPRSSPRIPPSVGSSTLAAAAGGVGIASAGLIPTVRHYTSSVWTMEHKLEMNTGVLKKIEAQVSEILQSQIETRNLLDQVLSDEEKIIKALGELKEVKSLKRVALVSLVAISMGGATIGLAALGVCYYYGVSYGEAKDSFVQFVSSFAHEVLQSSELQKDAEPYGASIAGAFRKSLFRWGSNPEVMSKSQFAEIVSSFAYSAVSVMSSSDAPWKQSTLMEILNNIGNGDEAMNIQMLMYLSKLGYVTEEVKRYERLGIKYRTTTTVQSRKKSLNCVSQVPLKEKSLRW